MNKLPDNWRVSERNAGLVIAGADYGPGHFGIADASFSGPWVPTLPREQQALIASLIAAIPKMIDALEEIAKGRGPYKRDPLEFATACLEHAVETAKAALMEIGVEPVSA